MEEQFDFMLQRLKVGIIIAVLSFGVSIPLNIWKVQAYYLIGFLTGCLNFFFLNLSIYLVINMKYKKPVLLQRMFFIARYLLILNILLGTVNLNAAEIILFCIGLLSVNFSVIISSYRFKLSVREGG